MIPYQRRRRTAERAQRLRAQRDRISKDVFPRPVPCGPWPPPDPDWPRSAEIRAELNRYLISIGVR